MEVIYYKVTYYTRTRIPYVVIYSEDPGIRTDSEHIVTACYSDGSVAII